MQRLKAIREKKKKDLSRKAVKSQADTNSKLRRINQGIRLQLPTGYGHFVTFFPLAGGGGSYMFNKNTNPEALPALLRKIADEIEAKNQEKETENQ